MRPIQTHFLGGLLAATFLTVSAHAQGAASDPVPEPTELAVTEGGEADLPLTAADLLELQPEERSPGPYAAGETELASFLWQNRVLVIFADTEQDLNFLRQMDLISARLLPLTERGVVVLVDTDPAGRSPIRTKLRPRGFAAVLVDKDGRVISRRPSPWDVREIERTIDSTPLRLQELRERRDAIDPLRGGSR